MAEGLVNLLEVAVGTKLRLNGDAIVEVVNNLGDGYWIEVKYISVPQDPSLEGTQESVFAAEIIEVV